MREDKLRGMIGLCVRAHRASFGAEACAKSVSQGVCELLLADGAMARNSLEKYESICRANGVEILKLPAGLLAEASGRGAMAAAVEDRGFADAIRRLVEQDADERIKDLKGPEGRKEQNGRTENHCGGASVE